MGKHIAKTINYLIINNNKKPENCKALILGVTFKENCSDIRNSRVFSLHKCLTKFKITVDLFDPHAIHEDVFENYNVQLLKKIEKKYDVVILAVAHCEFLKMNLLNFKKFDGIIYDVKSVLDKKIITKRL